MTLADFIQFKSWAHFAGVSAFYLVCYLLSVFVWAFAFPSLPLRRWPWPVGTLVSMPFYLVAIAFATHGWWISAAIATAASTLVYSCVVAERKPRRGFWQVPADAPDAIDAKEPAPPGGVEQADDALAKQLSPPPNAQPLLALVGRGYDISYPPTAYSEPYWRKAVLDLTTQLAQAGHLLNHTTLAVLDLLRLAENQVEISDLLTSAERLEVPRQFRAYCAHWRELPNQAREAIAFSLAAACRAVGR